MPIKMYSDLECNNQINAIGWDKDLIIKLVNGEQIKLMNTAKGGDLATATVYLRNESNQPFALTRIYHPDKRLEIKVDSAWLIAGAVAKLTISFFVPTNITPSDVIKSGRILIEGNYIYEAK